MTILFKNHCHTPYPILHERADTWMVQTLCPNAIRTVFGKVICADSLNKPEYWRG
ncbi:MAG: hypothetical protein AAGF83_03135 [Cyanobacteria bacterium P01_G01_bin.67]